MTPQERAFVAAARSAVLATIGPGGRPRLVPICFVIAGEIAYSPLDDKPKQSDDPRRLARVRDLLRRPEAALLVDRWSEDWSQLGWLRLECRAGLLEPGGAEHAAAVAALRLKYPQYASHRLEDRPMIRLEAERAVSWGDLASG